MSIFAVLDKTETFNTLSITLTAVSGINGDDARVTGIPSLTVSTTADIGTEIRIVNNVGDDVTRNSGILFVRVPDTFTTPLAKITRAAELLTAY